MKRSWTVAIFSEGASIFPDCGTIELLAALERPHPKLLPVAKAWVETPALQSQGESPASLQKLWSQFQSNELGKARGTEAGKEPAGRELRGHGRLLLPGAERVSAVYGCSRPDPSAMPRLAATWTRSAAPVPSGSLQRERSGSLHSCGRTKRESDGLEPVYKTVQRRKLIPEFTKAKRPAASSANRGGALRCTASLGRGRSMRGWFKAGACSHRGHFE
ncbi:hypothetical protein P7K49_023328 [Saguinus oedipus]|uniref:Uncharacterized protein n=1 Tax=Saguinus oedipus TaxID=9490 RepID=A0ABQ9ULB8_SAGOE|nr:hypothetical protein P7K49_023328 [Saguinus oedipus]